MTGGGAALLLPFVLVSARLLVAAALVGTGMWLGRAVPVPASR